MTNASLLHVRGNKKRSKAVGLFSYPAKRIRTREKHSSMKAGAQVWCLGRGVGDEIARVMVIVAAVV